MSITFLIAAIIVCGLYWLLIKYVVSHKNVLARPEVEQLKIKKQLYWGMIIAFLVYLGSQLLIASKTTAWIPWLTIACYLVLWGVGGYLIWLAYRIEVKKEIDLVKKSNEQPFNNPVKFARSIVIVNFVSGLSIWFLAVAIPIFKIKLALWAPVIVVVSACKQLIFSRFEKKDAI